MWCVGRLTAEYRRRMYELLDLYAQPYRADQPVICIDEKSKQLLRHSRPPLPLAPGKPARVDYEYVRAGTCNIFVAVEPRGGQRVTQVTDHRGKVDFIRFTQHLIRHVYRSARRIHFVVDNLNIHFKRCFVETLGPKAAHQLLRRVVFHYTPKHASWLNMAEIEIAALSRQCLNRRIGDRSTIQCEVTAWQQRRNAEHRTIEWTFTRQLADQKLGSHYVS
jgi:DDE superfamily endonuclease